MATGQRNIGGWAQVTSIIGEYGGTPSTFCNPYFNGAARLNQLEVMLNENFSTEMAWTLGAASIADSISNCFIEPMISVNFNNVTVGAPFPGVSINDFSTYASQLAAHHSVISIGCEVERSNLSTGRQITVSDLDVLAPIVANLGKRFINYYFPQSKYEYITHTNYPYQDPVTTLHNWLSSPDDGISCGYYSTANDPLFTQTVVNNILGASSSDPAQYREFTSLAIVRIVDSVYQNTIANSQYRSLFASSGSGGPPPPKTTNVVVSAKVI